MTLSKQLRELAGKATQDCPNAMYLPLPVSMIPTILTALELQERLEKPETIRSVIVNPPYSWVSGTMTPRDFYEDTWQGKQADGLFSAITGAGVNALKGGAA